MKYTSIVQKRAIEAAVEQAERSHNRAKNCMPCLSMIGVYTTKDIEDTTRAALEESERTSKALKTILKNLD